jgi:hypothetical protein
MKLPNKLKQPRMGVRLPVQKIWPRHRRWVKSHGCCVPDCHTSSVDFAHLRSARNAGKGQTPHDIFGISLCRIHHDEQHRLGADAFGRKYQIDLCALAAEFARRSPDWQMRASLKLVAAAEIGGE